MDTQAIKNLQDHLVSLGYMTQQEVNTGYGIYGPKTTRAMNEFTANGGNPKTNVSGASGKTQEMVDAEYRAAVGSHPAITEVAKGGSSVDDIINAFSTGDLSGIKMANGQPFNAKDQTDALAQATEDNRAFYEAQQQNDTVAAQNALAQKQADYQDYLIKQGDQFQTDKTQLDQNAANTGMLFSSGRVQKEQKLQNSYSQAQSSKLASLGRDVGSTANDFQYKYGQNAANGLSQYYNAGGNTYNANVATGGVGSQGLSSIYNPSQYNYGGGTISGEQARVNRERASRLLWNKGNKLLSTGYTNQIN